MIGELSKKEIKKFFLLSCSEQLNHASTWI